MSLIRNRVTKAKAELSSSPPTSDHKNCDWQVSGNTKQVSCRRSSNTVMRKHNMTIEDQTRDKVRNAIQKPAA